MSPQHPKPRFLDRHSPPHLMTLVLMAAMSSMAMNIFLPALPAMAEHYGTSYGVVQLSVSIFLGLSGALQIVIGPLSDRYGRRVVVLGSILIFLAATLGVLLAPTVEMMLFFRMIQAVIATGTVLSRAIVRDTVPAAEAASMIGWVTMGMAVVPMLTPSIGGVLSESLGWKAVFVMMLVAGGMLFALCWADLGETAPRGQSSLLAQIKAYPVLLRNRLFWGYALVAMAGSGAFFSFLGGAPAVGTMVHGLSPSRLGVMMALPGIGYIIGNFLSAKLATRLGIARMVVLGTTVGCLGLLLLLGLELAGLRSAFAFFLPMVLMGIGNGLLLPSANSGMMSVRADLIGSASGLGGALTMCGGAALAALASAVMGAGTSAMPLILLMFGCSVVGLILGQALLVASRRR